MPANLPDGAIVPVHPTQLYEVALALIMFAFLWQLGKKKLKPGQLFAAWMGLYAVERFVIEFVRAKGDRIAFGMSTSQVASIVLAVLAVFIWQRQATKPDQTIPAHARPPKASTAKAR